MSEALLVVSEVERGSLLAVGPDAASWLNGLVTCDVAAVRPAEGAFGLLLSKQGKIRSDFTILASPSGLLLAVAPGQAPELLETLDRFLVMEDAAIGDVSAEWAWARFHGAGAQSAAEATARAVGGIAAKVAWSGSEGAALALPRARLGELADALAPGARLASAEEWETYRVAHGIARFGVDFGTDDNPHEAGLDRLAISWQKGCYLGQEVVCMQDMRGKLKRRLVTLAVDDSQPPARGSKLTLTSGAEVGEVTSGARGDSHAWALARLKSPYFESNEELRVEGHAARVRAAG